MLHGCWPVVVVDAAALMSSSAHLLVWKNQDEIIDEVTKVIETKLTGSNTSRTFYTQSLLTGATLPALDGSKASQLSSSTSTQRE